MRINIAKVIVLIGLISLTLAYSYEEDEDEELVFQKLKEKLKGVFSNKDNA